MINALRNDDIIQKVGGRFRLTSLIQRRWLELMRGARPLVEHSGMTTIETVIEEIMQGKITIERDASASSSPDARKR